MRMCSWLAVLVLMLLLPLSSTNLYADGIRHSQGVEDVVRSYIVRIEAIKTWVSKCVDPTQLNLSRVLSGVKRGMWSCAYLELFNAMKGDPRVAWLVTPDVFLGMKVFALNGSGELELVDVVMIASYASLSPAVKEELLILLEALRQGDSSAVELAARLVLQEVSSPDANPVDRLLAALALQAVSEMGYEGVSLPEVSLRDFEALASLLTQLAHYTNSSAYRASIANASELFRRLALEGPSKELVSLADEVVAEYKLYPFRAPLLPFLMISALFPSTGSTSKRQLQVEQTIEILALVYKVLAEGRLRNVGIEEAIDIALEAVGSQDLKLDRRLVREVLIKVLSGEGTSGDVNISYVRSVIAELVKGYEQQRRERPAHGATGAAEGANAPPGEVLEEKNLGPDFVSSIPPRMRFSKPVHGMGPEMWGEEYGYGEDAEVGPGAPHAVGRRIFRGALTATIRSINRRLSVEAYRSVLEGLAEREVVVAEERSDRHEQGGVARGALVSAVVAAALTVPLLAYLVMRRSLLGLLAPARLTRRDEEGGFSGRDLDRVTELYWSAVRALLPVVPRSVSDTHREYLAKVRRTAALPRRVAEAFDRLTRIYELWRFGRRRSGIRDAEEAYHELLSHVREAG